MKGVRVVDMTSVLSGPYCTWLLASMGADVIKVESPLGDEARTTPPLKDGVSLYFASVNRGKRSIVLDLKSEKGREALHRLIAGADVLVENMRPGVRARLGCGDEDLARINPRLVVASISGFGQTGSQSRRRSYDFLVQAMSGMMSINGPLGGPATRVGFSIGDIAASLFTTISILERLYRRDARGEDPGPPIDMAMLACQWACLENAYARYLNLGIVAKPIGSRHPSMTPVEPYPTADIDIVIGIGSGREWPRLCRALGLDELAGDERFVDDAIRLENRDELDRIFSAHLRQKPSAHWLAVLAEAEIPAAPISNVKQFADSDIAREYAAFTQVADPAGKGLRFVRSPLRPQSAPSERPAPAHGEHSREVLAELGFGDAEIQAIMAR